MNAVEIDTAAIVRELVTGVHRRLDGGEEGRHGDPMSPAVEVHFDPGGTHELARTYVGIDGRRQMTGLLLELSMGTIRPTIHDIVGGPGWAVMSFTIDASVEEEPFHWIATSEFRFVGTDIVEDWIRPAPRHEVERFIRAGRAAGGRAAQPSNITPSEPGKKRGSP